MAPVHSELKLTAGIETECLLLTEYVQEEDYFETPSRTRRSQDRVYKALKAPMTATCSQSRKEVPFDLPLFRVGDKDHDGDFSKWDVDLDPSLGPTEAESVGFKKDLAKVHVTQIEIKSRILPLTDSIKIPTAGGHVHKITWEQEINAVYERLQKTFNDSRSGVARRNRLVTNETTSSHIHIGSGIDGFPLETLKKVVMIHVAHEPQFDSIHAANRITGSTMLSQRQPLREADATSFKTQKKTYNDPLILHLTESAIRHTARAASAESTEEGLGDSFYPCSRFSHDNSLKLASQKFDVGSFLEVIVKATSIKDLQDLLNGKGHNSTVNLDNLGTHEEAGISNRGGVSEKKMTVEFRQGAGSLCPVEAVNWITVLKSIFHYAAVTPLEEVKALCVKNWQDPKYTFIDLLKELGHGEGDSVSRHYKQVLGLEISQKPYAEIVLEQERKAIDRFMAWDPLAPLARDMAATRARLIHPISVQGVMREKSVMGGYGQFTETYLESQEVTPEQREYLTVGYYPRWAKDGVDVWNCGTAPNPGRTGHWDCPESSSCRGVVNGDDLCLNVTDQATE